MRCSEASPVTIWEGLCSHLLGARKVGLVQECKLNRRFQWTPWLFVLEYEIGGSLFFPIVIVLGAHGALITGPPAYPNAKICRYSSFLCKVA